MAKKNMALEIARGILLFIVNIIVMLLIVFALIQVCKMSYDFSYQIFGDVVVSSPPGQSSVFKVEKNESEWEVSKRLKNEKLIVNAYSFYIRLQLTANKSKKLTEGEYMLNSSMTYEEILQKIVGEGTSYET